MSESDDQRATGYDEFIDALEAGDASYYKCSNGHGLLPPRHVCPHCGDRELETVALPESGEIETYTAVAVPTPAFDDDAPYVTAIASFGPVRLTGILCGVDEDDLKIGDTVSATVELSETTSDQTIVFRLTHDNATQD